MDILQESLFLRLLARYERTFGEAPPFRTASLGDAIDYMRDRLGACENATIAEFGRSGYRQPPL
jgi:hypothetical protein